MKRVITFGAGLLLALILLFFAGCQMPGMVSNLQDQVDDNADSIEDIWAAISDIRLDIAGLDVRVSANEDAIDDIVDELGDIWDDIARVERESDDADTALQADIDDLRDDMLNKYNELVDWLEGHDRGLMLAFRAIFATNVRISYLADYFQDELDQLENDLNSAVADLQEQIDDNADAIADNAGDIADNAAQIALIWTDLANVWATYNTAYATVMQMFNQIDSQIVAVRNRLDAVEADLLTRITLAQAEQEVYRILFGDNAMDANGQIKPYFEDKMYWSGNFQGFSRVLSGAWYEFAQGIKNDSYTPPTHYVNAAIQALRDYYVSVDEANLVVAGLESRLTLLEATTLTWEGSGNSFPTPAEFGMVFVRDDFGFAFIFDGTEWVPLDASRNFNLGTIVQNYPSASSLPFAGTENFEKVGAYLQTTGATGWEDGLEIPFLPGKAIADGNIAATLHVSWYGDLAAGTYNQDEYAKVGQLFYDGGRVDYELRIMPSDIGEANANVTLRRKNYDGTETVVLEAKTPITDNGDRIATKVTFSDGQVSLYVATDGGFSWSGSYAQNILSELSMVEFIQPNYRKTIPSGYIEYPARIRYWNIAQY